MQARLPARDRFDDEHLLWLKSLILLTFTALASSRPGIMASCSRFCSIIPRAWPRRSR
jgi:hypothetical protein